MGTVQIKAFGSRPATLCQFLFCEFFEFARLCGCSDGVAVRLGRYRLEIPVLKGGTSPSFGCSRVRPESHKCKCSCSRESDLPKVLTLIKCIYILNQLHQLLRCSWSLHSGVLRFSLLGLFGSMGENNQRSGKIEKNGNWIKTEQKSKSEVEMGTWMG